MRSRHLIPSIISMLVFVSCNKSGKTKNQEMETWARHNYAYAYHLYLKGILDSAYIFYNNALSATRDSLLKAKAHNGIALIQYDVGDYYGAKESIGFSDSALDPSNPAHDSCRLSNYTVLGNVSINLGNYDEGIKYLDQAIAFEHFSDFKLNVLNGKAFALQKKGDLAAAAHLLDSILKNGIRDTIIKARTLGNFARAKWQMDPSYDPLPEYRETVRLYTSHQYTYYPGLVTSYENFSEYYTSSQPDSALYYAQLMYQAAKYAQSPDDRLEALQRLIERSSPMQVKIYLQEYFQLGDSIKTARNNAKNQFALQRYETEKSKAENLRLKKNVSQQRLVTYLTIIAAVIIALCIVMAYRKKQRRIRREAESKIRENKLKTSQKVHDVVANGLYRIMNDLEHSDEIDKEKILDKVEVLYEQSRDISYEDKMQVDTASSQTIVSMLTSFANEKTRVLVTGDVDSVTGLSFTARTQLIHVLEELMINMQKHSGAKNVVIKFGMEGRNVTVDYKDDGSGFNSRTIFGNGLKSTVNRISSIKGEIKFEPDVKDGCRIKIRIPEEK